MSTSVCGTINSLLPWVPSPVRRNTPHSSPSSGLLNLRTTGIWGGEACLVQGRIFSSPLLGMTFKTAPSVKRARGEVGGWEESNAPTEMQDLVRRPREFSTNKVPGALGGWTPQQQRLRQSESGKGCLIPSRRKAQTLTQAALPLSRQCSKVIFTFVEIGDGGGCVLEGDPERKSWLLTHSV